MSNSDKERLAALEKTDSWVRALLPGVYIVIIALLSSAVFAGIYINDIRVKSNDIEEKSKHLAIEMDSLRVIFEEIRVNTAKAKETVENLLTESETRLRVAKKLESIYSNVKDKVTIASAGTTWVELKNKESGEIIFQGILNKGEVIIVDMPENVFLTSGDAGVTRVYLGEQHVPFQWRKGEIVKSILLHPFGLRAILEG